MLMWIVLCCRLEIQVPGCRSRDCGGAPSLLGYLPPHFHNPELLLDQSKGVEPSVRLRPCRTSSLTYVYGPIRDDDAKQTSANQRCAVSQSTQAFWKGEASKEQSAVFIRSKSFPSVANSQSVETQTKEQGSNRTRTQRT